MLIIVVAVFAILIYFSLKYRKTFLAQNLQLTADQVWQNVNIKTDHARIKKSDLLFGIQQDGSASTVIFVVKNFNNEVVGRIECRMGSHEYQIWVGSDLYRISFLLSGWRSAQLTSDKAPSVLATYKMLNVLGKHEINIPGYGVLISERATFINWLGVFRYRAAKNFIGLKQQISPTREIGKLVVLPPEIPLYLRIFILAL